MRWTRYALLSLLLVFGGCQSLDSISADFHEIQVDFRELKTETVPALQGLASTANSTARIMQLFAPSESPEVAPVAVAGGFESNPWWMKILFVIAGGGGLFSIGKTSKRNYHHYQDLKRRANGAEE